MIANWFLVAAMFRQVCRLFDGQPHGLDNISHMAGSLPRDFVPCLDFPKLAPGGQVSAKGPPEPGSSPGTHRSPHWMTVLQTEAHKRMELARPALGFGNQATSHGESHSHYHIWLVVWLPSIWHFPIYWECHHPNWLFIFFRGVAKPPTRYACTLLFLIDRWIDNFL